MSWLFSQVLVEEFLGVNSSDGEQSVPLNGSPIPLAYCAPDKMTKFSTLSQYGITFKPLTESRGEELLMLFRAAFHVPTSHHQEEAQELMEKPLECGEKWRASFTKYDPDMSLWKTHQCSLLGDSEEFSGTWPRWGLMRGGACWEQQTLGHRIKETESGWLGKKWPTPQASDNRDRGNMSSPVVRRRMAIGKQLLLSQSVDPTSGQLNPTWTEWLMGWPLEWTDLQPLEMDKSHCAPPPHGKS
jgi:hypothetical protein